MKRFEPGSVRSLLVRATNWVGDAVLSTPALHVIRKGFPSARITVLAKPVVAELLRHHPDLDELLVYDNPGRHAGVPGRFRLVAEIKERAFDAAVLLQNAFEAALLAYLARIPVRYGYDTDARGMLLTWSVPVTAEIRKKHQVYYYMDLLEPLGLDIIPMRPSLALAPDEEDEADRWLKSGGLKLATLVGLSPGASYGSAKCWNPERYAELSDRLAREYDAAVLIFGASSERRLADKIAAKMSTPPRILCGERTLRQSMALIKRLNLFITNDSGLMHVADTFGVPIVAIFGPTDPNATSPFSPDHAVVRKPVFCSPCLLRDCPIDHRCMAQIGVEDVWEPAVERLKPPPSRRSETGRIAIFLDRDGTLNEEVGYAHRLDQLALLPGALEAVRAINQRGLRAVVISNQAGVAKGLFEEADVVRFNEGLSALMGREGVRLDAFYFCPHHPEGTRDGYATRCVCRKPAPGMLLQAAKDLNVDISRSYVIGDRISDVLMARTAGCSPVLVLTGNGAKEWEERKGDALVHPDYVARDVLDAVRWVLEDIRRKDPKGLPVSRPSIAKRDA